MANYAIFGLGISGKASLNFLSKKHKVIAYDDNQNALTGVNSNLIQNLYETNFEFIDYLVISPGIAPNHKIYQSAKAAGTKIICDIELLYQHNRHAKFIGITGTNGKSTTTALTHHILSSAGINSQLGGNIGIAALSLPQVNNGYYTLELSSYQLDLLDKTQFDIACHLNLSADHLERYGNMQNYAASKSRIFKSCGLGITGVDDELSTKFYDTYDDLIPISASNKPEGIYAHHGILYDRGAAICNLGIAKALLGQHNQQNICAAYAIAKAAGVNERQFKDALKTFTGLAHRMEIVPNNKGITIINDSKATNADATAKALGSFESNIYWILGGQAKDGGIKELEPYFNRVKKAYLIGAAQNEFASLLDGKIDYIKCDVLETATKQALKDCTSGTILLSPACASWDQFKNFEERGDVFKELIKINDF